MKISSPWIMKLAGFVGSIGLSAWMRTLDYRIAYYDPTLDPGLHLSIRQRIYICWHEYFFIPTYLRGHCNIAMLISQHRDTEILRNSLPFFGFDYVRGSSTRGGAAAMREMFRKGKAMHITLTPDGQRGPRRQQAIGTVYLASRLGMPIVTMGLGYDRPWRVRKAWDQFALPRPGSRARVVLGPEVFVPPNLKRKQLEHWRMRIEDLLNRMTSEAEAWAEDGRPRAGEYRCRKAIAPEKSGKAA